MTEERRLTERGKERRQALIFYAARAFADAGYHPTSVSDIVDGVGVGKGVFYWYFDSKEALLREILRDALHELRTTQGQALAGCETPLDMLEAGIRSSLHWSAANPDILRITSFGWSEEPFSTALLRGRDIIVADTAAIIQKAIDAGQIHPGSATVLATAVHGVTDELGRTFHQDETVDADELVDLAVRFCLDGLRG